MTDATTHLNELAQRYAKALVDYHIRGQIAHDYDTLIDLQNMMNEVAREVAAEAGY